MLQDIADTEWIMRPEVQSGLSAMADAGLRLDVLAKPRHLPLLPELAQRHPDLRMVIDHGAKPAIADGASSLGQTTSRAWLARPRRSASSPDW